MADTTEPAARWIGNDCPPEWRCVGTIDVADPADTAWARDRGYRIGAIYDGRSGSCAEPCAADIYEEITDTNDPDATARLGAVQRSRGCNQDNEPSDWGRPCCAACVCATEASGRTGMEDMLREAGL